MKKRLSLILQIISMSVILSMLVGCGPSAAGLEAVDYTPVSGDEWPVSTPEEQGLDPKLVAELYYKAAQLDSLKPFGMPYGHSGHRLRDVLRKVS